MWPDEVERVAAALRSVGAEGRLEELPAGEDSLPGVAVRAAGFACDGRPLVAIVPADRPIDRDRLAAAAGCRNLRPEPLPAFPFEGARVLFERLLLGHETLWLEAGSPRYALGLAPTELARVTRAERADLLLAPTGGG